MAPERWARVVAHEGSGYSVLPHRTVAVRGQSQITHTPVRVEGCPRAALWSAAPSRRMATPLASRANGSIIGDGPASYLRTADPRSDRPRRDRRMGRPRCLSTFLGWIASETARSAAISRSCVADDCRPRPAWWSATPLQRAVPVRPRRRQHRRVHLDSPLAAAYHVTRV